MKHPLMTILTSRGALLNQHKLSRSDHAASQFRLSWGEVARSQTKRQPVSSGPIESYTEALMGSHESYMSQKRSMYKTHLLDPLVASNNQMKLLFDVHDETQ